VSHHLNRIAPVAPAGAFKTYSVVQRTDLLLRTACEKAGCDAWLKGWRVVANESQDCGVGSSCVCRWATSGALPCGTCLARYFRFQSGRTFTEQRAGDGLTVFTFESHQRCFAEHKTQPQHFLVRGGDWRNMVWVQVAPGVWDWRHDPRRVEQVHQNPADWVEDFGEHQQRVAADQARG
jgi:hypothetical protein